MPLFLHVGCGSKRKHQTTPGFNTDEWQERRFDIDPAAKPDLIGTMTDMASVADASVEALRQKLAAYIARTLPRCPCCGRGRLNL